MFKSTMLFSHLTKKKFKNESIRLCVLLKFDCIFIIVIQKQLFLIYIGDHEYYQAGKSYCQTI